MADEFKAARGSWVSEPADTQMPELNFTGVTEGMDMTAQGFGSFAPGLRGGAHVARGLGRAGRQVGRAARRHPFVAGFVAVTGGAFIAGGMGL